MQVYMRVKKCIRMSTASVTCRYGYTWGDVTSVLMRDLDHIVYFFTTKPLASGDVETVIFIYLFDTSVV